MTIQKIFEEYDMTDPLRMLDVTRRRGPERFRVGSREADFDLVAFWQWSCSDLLSNATRGVLAEFLVAQALGIAQRGVRLEWAAYDLQTEEGITVEVKSAAYLQRWRQDRFSRITFLVPKTRARDPRTNRMLAESARQAQVYVFALLAHQDKETVDPLDLDQWVFYVLPTARLNERTRSQHSITLPTLQALSGGPIAFQDLPAAVRKAAQPEPGRNTRLGDPFAAQGPTRLGTNE